MGLVLILSGVASVCPYLAYSVYLAHRIPDQGSVLRAHGLHDRDGLYLEADGTQ